MTELSEQIRKFQKFEKLLLTSVEESDTMSKVDERRKNTKKKIKKVLTNEIDCDKI